MSNKDGKKKSGSGTKKPGTKKAVTKKSGTKKSESKTSSKTTGKSTGSKKTAGVKSGTAAAPKKSNTNRQQTKLRLVKNADIEPVVKEKKEKGKVLYRDKPEAGDWFLQHKSLVIIGATVTLILLALAAAYIYIIKTYTVTTVYVDGNVHYTNEEVMDMVMTGYYGNNSLYLSLKYQNKGVEGVPFVEKMDVNILSPNTIRINVYEKALAGYVEYLGRYMYFDKDGIVVESSNKRTSGVPQVTGLKYNYVVMYEPLPVESDDIFKRVLNITQLLGKYSLAADKIYFDTYYNLTLYFEEIKVTLGSSDYIDEKIMRLKSILPKLEGKKGTLQLESFNEDTKNITFIEN